MWSWNSKQTLTRCEAIEEKYQGKTIFKELTEGISAEIDSFPGDFIEIQAVGLEEINFKWEISAQVRPKIFFINMANISQVECAGYAPYPEYLKKTGRFKLHPFKN